MSRLVALRRMGAFALLLAAFKRCRLDTEKSGVVGCAPGRSCEGQRWSRAERARWSGLRVERHEVRRSVVRSLRDAGLAGGQRRGSAMTDSTRRVAECRTLLARAAAVSTVCDPQGV